MKIATFEGENTLDALAARIYGGSRTGELAARLLAANPHLRDMQSLPRGTPVVVPEEGVIAGDAVDPRLAAAIEAAGADLDALEDRRLEVLSRRQETLERLRGLVRSENVTEVMKELDGSRLDTLKQIDVTAAAELQQVEAQKKTAAAEIARVRLQFTGKKGKRRSVRPR